MNPVRRAVSRFLTGLSGSVLEADVVAVACSGGADSLALAEATVHDGRFAVHGLVVDHGLQANSASVARRAAEQLTALGCAKVRVLAVRVDGSANVEAAARAARYAALDSARPHAGALVLLGHTLDDQAETVLLGLGRGSGPRSIAGMRELDPPWGRPLLGVRRADTVAACHSLGLPVWDDPHNTSARFRRVRLRHEVLPLLEDVLAGGVAPALARTAAQLREDCDALDALADTLLRTALRAGFGSAGGGLDGAGFDRAGFDRVGVSSAGGAGGSFTGLDVATLVSAPPALRRRAVRAWLLASGVPRLSDAQLRSVDAMVDRDRWHGQGPVALPGHFDVSREAGRLVIDPRPQ